MDSSLISFVGTLLGGLIAGSVSLFTTNKVLEGTSRREQIRLDADRANQRQALLRVKVEELVAHLLEHLKFRERFSSEIKVMAISSTGASWFREEQGAYDRWQEHDHIKRAVVIQALYFPDIEALLEAIKDATTFHMKFCSAELKAISSDRTHWIANEAVGFPSRNEEALLSLRRAHDACLVAMRDKLHELLL